MQIIGGGGHAPPVPLPIPTALLYTCIRFMLVIETAPINIYHKLRSQLSAFQVSLWVKMSIR